MRSSRKEQCENLIVKLLIILRKKIKGKQPKKSMTLHRKCCDDSGSKGPWRWNATCMLKSGRSLKEYESRQKARIVENYKRLLQRAGSKMDKDEAAHCFPRWCVTQDGRYFSTQHIQDCSWKLVFQLEK